MNRSPSELSFRHHSVIVNDSALHVVEAGDPDGRPFLLVHGWPESWHTWRSVMGLASARVRAIAFDLPGIGESAGAATDGSKRELADTVHGLISALNLRDVTLVGHDIGGMVVYSYLRRHRDIARAVIMNVAVPGIEPWDEVIRDPYIWHFGFHATPELPERLVQGRQEEYFGFFYDVNSPDPAKITPEARAAHVSAYSTDQALTAGFSWYRAFQRDAEENKAAAEQPPVSTPLLYLRGEHERGDIDTLAKGIRAAGVTHLEHEVIPGAGHFAQEDAPAHVWRLMARFAGI